MSFVNRTDDERALMFLEHRSLVQKHVTRIMAKLPSDVVRDDIESAANLGLLMAIDRFDPSKGVSFSTFADYRVRGAIYDELRSAEWAPRTVIENINLVAKARRKAEAKHGHLPSEKHQADAVGLSLDEYRQIRARAKKHKIVSFESGFRKQDGGDLGLGYVERVGSTLTEPTDQLIESAETLALFDPAMDLLSSQEALILGLQFFEDLTQRDIAKILCISESRVSKLHTDALSAVVDLIGSAECQRADEVV